MNKGERQGGVQRQQQTEQTIFKLIWVQCTLFVQWQHKDTDTALIGPPATKCMFLQMESFGTLTRRAVKKRYIAGNQPINMISGGLRLCDAMALVLVALYIVSHVLIRYNLYRFP